MSGWMDGWIGGWMGGLMDGWVNGLLGGLMDGWVEDEGLTAVSSITPLPQRKIGLCSVYMIKSCLTRRVTENFM